MAVTGIPISRAVPGRRAFARALAVCALAGGVACSGPASAQTALPSARDLRASAAQAARRGGPLVLMFSLPGCTYCERLRRDTYRWMLRDGVDVEQVDMSSARPLRGFDGRPTSGQALARHYAVHLAPTVLFLGPGGREIGERLVGAGEPDFYQAFVDRSMRQARAQLRAG